MDVRSVALQSSSSGLLPATSVKQVLDSGSVMARLPIGNSIANLSEEAFQQALLHEALLYLIRSMSHLAAYEAAIANGQFSWGAVTLYYANYFCALSMNRIAGEAVSTSSASGKHYNIKFIAPPYTFDVKQVTVNNHADVWATNYRLYENFIWRDTSMDNTIVKVPTNLRSHRERKDREFINYHPLSYKELFAEAATIREIKKYCGRYYTLPPDQLGLLPLKDDFEKTIANFESGAVSRQIILLEIFKAINVNMTGFGGSRFEVTSKFSNFSRNYLARPPFSTCLKAVYVEALKPFNTNT